ncbi:MAG: CYTH domain-containing protein [Patescibacteria group bacterium]
MEEIEVKFLDVNIESLEKKLLDMGAEKIGETLSRITCFDYPDYQLRDKNAWVRLRTEFNETTLAYKERLGVSSEDASIKDDGMREIEVVVSDFDTTKSFLFEIGMIEKFSQEKKRIRFKKDTIVFDIDTWPLTPPYIEIEGSSWDDVKTAAENLGFKYEDHLRCSAHNIFIKYGFNDHDYSVFTFAEQIKK